MKRQYVRLIEEIMLHCSKDTKHHKKGFVRFSVGKRGYLVKPSKGDIDYVANMRKVRGSYPKSLKVKFSDWSCGVLMSASKTIKEEEYEKWNKSKK